MRAELLTHRCRRASAEVVAIQSTQSCVLFSEPGVDVKAGDLLADRYRLLRTIGEGGMGSVWAAHHELIGRDVAIKVTGEKVSKRREIRERFLNEARAVGKVRHPNVIDVMDVGQLPDSRLYIVFELLEGRTLEEQLHKKGRLPAGDAARIVVEVCRGLEAAHGAGVVHRDLKPANVFLHRAPGGGVVIKLLDFGISKTVDDEGVSLSVTQTGVVMGTPQYMSVEQARGRDDIDVRTDIWSAGAILYELATGRVAFDAPNYNAVIDRIMHEESLPLISSGVNEPGLQLVVSRCLAKQRSQRFQTAHELREALETLLPTLPVGAGGLKLQGSIGMPAMRSVSSIPPARPSDPTQANVSRHDATLMAPPSEPRITPVPAEPSAPVEARPIEARPIEARPIESTPEAPIAQRASTGRRTRTLAVSLATVAVAGFLLIAFGRSSESTTSQVTPPSPAVVAEAPRIDPTPMSTPSSPPIEAIASSTALAPRAASSAASRKPARAPGDAPRPKGVTRVESAGF